ncbi:unnamed protein product [Meloidogyne enterolobii]
MEEKFQHIKNETDISIKQKDEKINSLEVEIKKIGDLTIKLNNVIFKNVEFIKVKNKWSEIENSYKCCSNNCINTKIPIGNCVEGYGFGNLINDENIKYLVGKGSCNKFVVVSAENSFNKPQNCLNYSLFYFEIKCKFEGELNIDKTRMNIGLKNCSTDKYILCLAKAAKIINEKDGEFKLKTNFNDNDIFGCGLVFPPTNKINKYPYAFFTQNGKQISKYLIKNNFTKIVFLGKGVLSKYNSDLYKPYVELVCCSVETNFGNDLETKPFKYDIPRHFILKEFY